MPYLSRAAVRGFSSSARPRLEISNDLLEFIVCPLSKERLRYDKIKNELINDTLGVAYPVKDGIPILNPTKGRIINQ